MRKHRTRGMATAVVVALMALTITQSFVPATAAEDGVTTGLVEITAKAIEDHEVDDTEWHFVINQVPEADAPADIAVTFDDGTVVHVPLDKYTGKVAHYTYVGHLDAVVVAATAMITPDWHGQFNLSHGPAWHPTTTTTVPETTTTTVPETTTTTVPETTTTTVPETTTTTVPETTTTTVPETTTTTVPETTTTVPTVTVTVPAEVTTTTAPAEVTTTTAPAEVLGVTVEREELPRTGRDTGVALVLGGAVVLVGVALTVAERRRTVR